MKFSRYIRGISIACAGKRFRSGTISFTGGFFFTCIGVSDAIEEAMLPRFTRCALCCSANRESDFRLFPMGLSGLEPPTSRLSGVRSNRLSYKPILIWRPPTLPHRLQCSTLGRPGLNHRVRDGNGCYPWAHRHQRVLVILDNPTIDNSSLLYSSLERR